MFLYLKIKYDSPKIYVEIAWWSENVDYHRYQLALECVLWEIYILIFTRYLV